MLLVKINKKKIVFSEQSETLRAKKTQVFYLSYGCDRNGKWIKFYRSGASLLPPKKSKGTIFFSLNNMNLEAHFLLLTLFDNFNF